jgi:hypothetical protein
MVSIHLLRAIDNINIAYISIDCHMETVSSAVIIENKKDFFGTGAGV